MERLVVHPQRLVAHLDGRVIRSLIPEHLIFKLVGVHVVTDDQALEVLSTLVHERAKHLKCRKHTCVIFVNPTTIT